MTPHLTPVDTHWRTSTYSSSHGGQCVEVGTTDGLVAVRDTKKPEAGTLTMDQKDWNGLLAVLKQC